MLFGRVVCLRVGVFATCVFVFVYICMGCSLASVRCLFGCVFVCMVVVCVLIACVWFG